MKIIWSEDPHILDNIYSLYQKLYNPKAPTAEACLENIQRNIEDMHRILIKRKTYGTFATEWKKFQKRVKKKLKEGEMANLDVTSYFGGRYPPGDHLIGF